MRIFIFLYFIVGLTDLVLLNYNPDLRWVSKPLIIISLGAFFLSKAPLTSLQNKLFISGLFFALLGDIFLLSDESQFFLLGLGSFLVMQLMYISVYSYNWGEVSKLKITISIFYGFALIFYLMLLWADMGDMLIPIAIYGAIITAMAICSVFRKRNLPGYWSILLGSLLFMISDGIIGFTRYVNPFNYGPTLIMTTYIFAQYLIVKGWLESINYEKSLINSSQD